MVSFSGSRQGSTEKKIRLKNKEEKDKREKKYEKRNLVFTRTCNGTWNGTDADQR